MVVLRLILGKLNSILKLSFKKKVVVPSIMLSDVVFRFLLYLIFDVELLSI